MKRLQFLLALPAAALGETTKPAVSRAARDTAKTFGVPFVLGGQNLQKVFVHSANNKSGVFYFEDFKIEIGQYRYPKGVWVPISICSLIRPEVGFHSSLGAIAEELVKQAFEKYQQLAPWYKQI